MHFYRPKTLKLRRKPLYPAALPASGVEKMDKYAVIKAPVTSDAAMQKIETHNTLVFLCDVQVPSKVLVHQQNVLFTSDHEDQVFSVIIMKV